MRYSDATSGGGGTEVLPSAASAVPSSAALAVAAAYDSHVDRGVAVRAQSSIMHLRNFNNWVKACLIAEYAPRPARRVLDLACGKLGDLLKWRLAGAEMYCGADISLTGVRDGCARFNARSGSRGAGSSGTMRAKLIRADLGATSLRLAGALAAGEEFDCISIQFAMHYLFQTEARALAFFRNVADALAVGGVFLGTIPDAAYLVRRARDLPPGRRGFGNALYSVEFDVDALRRQWCLGDDPWGVAYDFWLTESVEHVKEYLVPWQLLKRLAASVGLVPLARDGFHAFYERLTDARHPRGAEHRATLASMRVLDCEGTMRGEEWEAAGVYRVFAFRRVWSEAQVARALQEGAGPGAEAPSQKELPMPVAALPSAEELFPHGVPVSAPAAHCGYQAVVEESQIIDLLP